MLEPAFSHTRTFTLNVACASFSAYKLTAFTDGSLSEWLCINCTTDAANLSQLRTLQAARNPYMYIAVSCNEIFLRRITLGNSVVRIALAVRGT
jgi:hypothetical protein